MKASMMRRYINSQKSVAYTIHRLVKEEQARMGLVLDVYIVAQQLAAKGSSLMSCYEEADSLIHASRQ